jgi:hypothetical protein
MNTTEPGTQDAELAQPERQKWYHWHRDSDGAKEKKGSADEIDYVEEVDGSGGNSERESPITRMWDGKSRDSAMKDFRCSSLFLLDGSRFLAARSLEFHVQMVSSVRR